jgi:alanine dehydrogenase
MAELPCLSDAEVRDNLPLDALADALQSALVALADGSASVPARTGAATPTGLLGAMPGYVPGLGPGLGAKLVSVFPDNDPGIAPSHQALIALFDSATGTPLVVMDGAYITAIRTAMTSALAARALVRPGSRVVAILGAGVQGEAHLDAFTHVLAPAEIRIASRDAEKATGVAGRHVDARVSASFLEAVDGADIVCCCTDASEPVLEADWIGPGVHVSSVGSGNELPPTLLARARVFVESIATVTAPWPAGARDLTGCDPTSLVDIGAVLAGRAVGRRSDDDVTVFKSVGNAAEDIAAATVVWDRFRHTPPGQLQYPRCRGT